LCLGVWRFASKSCYGSDDLAGFLVAQATAFFRLLLVFKNQTISNSDLACGAALRNRAGKD
jgi:membrane-associated phospholipid phosphatase